MVSLGGTVTLRGLGTLVVILLLATSGFAPAAGAEPVPVPPGIPSRLQAEPIAARVVGPETLIVQLMSGYCVGDPYRPYIERVGIRWQRLSPVRFRAVLTALVRSPVDPLAARAEEGPPSIKVCAGIGYLLRSKVVLPQPVARTEPFDGSFSPMRRMESRPPFLVVPERHS